MKIYIPTKGRVDNQTCYSQLKNAGLKPVLVVDRSEYKEHKDAGYDCVACPDGNLPAKRHFMLRLAGKEPFAHIDDDVVISKVQRNHKISTATPADLRRLFNVEAPRLLKTYALGGVHVRQFVHTKPYPYVTNRGWCWRSVFMNPSLFKEKFSYMPYRYTTGSDVYAMIRLVKQGLDWFLTTNFCCQEITPPSGSHNTWELKQKEFKKLLRDEGVEKHLMWITTKEGRKQILRWSAMHKEAVTGDF